LHYHGEAFLIFDGLQVHSSDFFLDECTHFNVNSILLPVHSSDQTQPLDLGIFGPQKGERKILPREDLSEQVREILQIFCSWQRAAVPPNIVSAFKQAGFLYSLDSNDTLRCSVDIEYARRIRDRPGKSPPLYKSIRIPLGSGPFDTVYVSASESETEEIEKLTPEE
jgi:hypothetical protein